MKDWRETQLGAVARLERSIVDPRCIQGDTKYVGLEHVDGDGQLAAVGSVEAGMLKSTKFRFSDQHVLYGKLRPYLRKVARPHFSGVCSTDILPILPGPDLDRDFLFHFLRQPCIVSLAATRSDGVNLPRVSPKTLLSFPVSLPPLTEQRRIAALLDKADIVIRKRREGLRLLDGFLRSVFLELFGDPVKREDGWDTVKLDEISEIASGVTIGRKLDVSATTDVPYLRVANVHDGRLDLAEVKTTPATHQDRAQYRLLPGDVVLTEGGDPDKLGRGAVWRGEIGECIHQNHIFRVRFQHGFVPDYVSALLGSTYGKRYFLRAAKQTTGIASINRSQLAAFPVIAAPHSMQRQYEAVAARVTSLSTKYRSALEVTERLRDSITQIVFGGHE